jgi:hypothetical protein
MVAYRESILLGQQENHVRAADRDRGHYGGYAPDRPADGRRNQIEFRVTHNEIPPNSVRRSNRAPGFPLTSILAKLSVDDIG